MKKLMAVAFVMLGVASSAWSQSTTNTQCTSYSSDSMNCSSTTTQTGPTAAQVEQQRELNENASKLGAGLGAIVYQKRMQHAQEKSDLTAVVFCRQNPSGTWTFPNKPPMSCSLLAKNVVAYCTVNAKKSLCKDVSKLGPSPVPVASQTMPQIQKAQPAEQPVAVAQTQREAATQPAFDPAQPVQNVVRQPETVNVTANPVAEVSVAEAARQARIAKAVREAKEKAERDNPASPPQ